MPTSILGLPTYTVAGLAQIAATGALDGRFAAVAGYWAQFALPCPYMPHQPVIAGFCSGGSFADTAQAAQTCCGTGTAPIAVPESANGDKLWSLSSVGSSPPGFSGGGSVVLIVHAADPREWQCDPNGRAACHSRLVIDSVAWANGLPLALAPQNPDAGVAMTLDQVAAAALGPGEQLVTAYPLRATDLNEVDPRFLGQGVGLVWYARVMTGAPAADATAAGKDVLISDESGEVVATLPLSVDPAYSAARLVLDTNGSVPDQFQQAHFEVARGELAITSGVLDSSLPPFALEPGDYTLRAWGNSGAILASPRPAAQCSKDLTVAAGDDLAYYANWPGRGDCTWKQGSLWGN